MFGFMVWLVLRVGLWAGLVVRGTTGGFQDVGDRASGQVAL